VASVNEVRIMGNLGADPELRYTTAGKAVATLSIATTKQWTDEKGEKKEDTQWHRVVVWGRQSEAVNSHKKKGDQLYIEGELRTRKYQDAKGEDRWTTEVHASRVLFTGRAPNNRPGHPAEDDYVPPEPLDGDQDIPF
jgi:single-strand DNA-binding protein